MKQCKGCKRILPLGEFYSHSGMKDKHLSFCKGCVIKCVKEYRLNNVEKIRTYDRERGKLPHRIKASMKYTKEYRKTHPDRYVATNKINNTIRDKKFKKKQCCEHCRRKTKLCAHHENYLQPLQVIWLCYVCHKQIHLKGKTMGRRTFKDRENLVCKAMNYYEEGRSMQSIANTLHVSVATVCNLLKEAGVTTRPRGRPVTV